jgi:hypothetical protein
MIFMTLPMRRQNANFTRPQLAGGASANKSIPTGIRSGPEEFGPANQAFLSKALHQLRSCHLLARRNIGQLANASSGLN